MRRRVCRTRRIGSEIPTIPRIDPNFQRFAGGCRPSALQGHSEPLQTRGDDDPRGLAVFTTNSTANSCGKTLPNRTGLLSLAHDADGSHSTGALPTRDRLRSSAR